MKTVLSTLLIVLISASPVLATTGGMAKGLSLLLILFLGFFALIVVFQFIPGLVLLYSMLKGLFKPVPKDSSTLEEKR